MDAWARELVATYPEQGRCHWSLVERPLYAALTDDTQVSPDEAWVALTARLAQQQRSYQWRVKQMIPRCDRWLSTGAHLQVLPEEAPVTTAPAPSVGTRNAAFLAARRQQGEP